MLPFSILFEWVNTRSAVEGQESAERRPQYPPDSSLLQFHSSSPKTGSNSIKPGHLPQSHQVRMAGLTSDYYHKTSLIISSNTYLHLHHGGGTVQAVPSGCR